MKTHIIWFAIATLALVIGTRLTKPEVRTVEKPVEVVRTKEVVVEKPVEVIKEVPKEVEKIVEKKVEVPAEIPELYKTALSFMEKFRSTKLVSQKDSLAGVDSVSVAITLADDVKKIISESEVRTKFEITLRRSGVPIDENSRFTLSYYQDGFTRDGPTLIYSFSTALEELVVAFRDGPAMRRIVGTWRRGNYGTVGISKARDALLSDAESAAETFANEWLAMNAKK
jgi:hypothetical protein